MQGKIARIPIYDGKGNIKAYAIVDGVDARRARRRRWWFRSSAGYVVTMVKGQRTTLQGFVYGPVPEGHLLDHINRDKLDNRRANLRAVTTAQNAQNQGSRGGSSRFRGVTWDKSREKWMATGMLGGKRRTLGRFDSEEEAGRVAAAWRAEHMPFSQEAAA